MSKIEYRELEHTYDAMGRHLTTVTPTVSSASECTRTFPGSDITSGTLVLP
jgi:hypothetical protein